MDIARPSNVRQKRIRQGIVIGIGLVVIAAVTVGLSRLQPAAPTVEAATLWPDTVKRGPMVRQVRGLGTLVPEDIRWIPATSQGRVERILLRPGTTVKAGNVILELSNPQLDQEAQDAELKVQSAEASLANLRVQVQNDLLQQRASAASINADYNKARMQAEMNDALAQKQLVSELTLRQSKLDEQQLDVRRKIAQEQLDTRAESSRAQIAVQQSAVDQARAVLQLKKRQYGELKVRAGLDGVLQVVPVDVGQQVAPGANLARVANPGRVMRIDPSVQNGTRTVDVSLEGDLPKGAVPDLSVDGTVELERLNDVLFVGRPAFGQEQSKVGLFKILPDGVNAERVQVTLGRSSVNTMEILAGLKVGDQVILSDMSAYDAYDRIRLK